MVAKNFQPSFTLVLKSEGGNVDDPADHGGRTSRGVTQHVYDAYRRLLGLPLRDVFRADESEIQDIYYQSYWEPWADQLPSGVDYAYFDFAVNSGGHRAMIELQRTVGVPADGIFGPMTREAIGRVDSRRLIVKYLNARRGFFESLHESRFIRGWLNRANAVELAALRMESENA